MSKIFALLIAASVLLLASAFRCVLTNSRYGGVLRKESCRISQLYAKSQPQEPQEKKGGLTLGGLVQLVLMGAGAPGLGEYKGTDPTTGKMMFELEANNLVNAKGEDIQTKAKFFKDGWVEGSAEALDNPPGFFENLLSGGKLQEEWDKRNRKNK